jgi:diguanylate cyclase (GGDEF)-like protein
MGLFPNIQYLFDEFIDKYTSYFAKDDTNQSHQIALSYYQEIFTTLNQNFDSQQLLNLFETLSKHQTSSDIPYIIITNELNNLKTFLIKNLEKESISKNIIDLITLFDAINNQVAFVYLQDYINKLKSINNIRISSLAELMDKNMLVHYESHLIWLSKLAESIQNKSIEDFPELDSTICDFGKWLDSEGKSIISNNSKYKGISQLHNNLHLFASKIYTNIQTQEHHIITTYLEKCEMLSLSIGTELALIDNILMNHKVMKDPLTGALNRQGLNNIFKNQYELSLATSNPFVFAMCDLDNFKDVNDTYGHLFGDKTLIHFVKIVKKNIRNSDIIMRYGGEEFVIMLPAVYKEQAMLVLEKIRKEFYEDCLEYEGKPIKNSVSIGFVEIKPNLHYKPHFLDDYLSMADQKLYSAKNNGRNTIEFCC